MRLFSAAFLLAAGLASAQDKALSDLSLEPPLINTRPEEERGQCATA